MVVMVKKMGSNMPYEEAVAEFYIFNALVEFLLQKHVPIRSMAFKCRKPPITQ